MTAHTATIQALLHEIDQRIISASISVRAAIAAMADCKQNECIGTLIPAEQDLRIALDLHRSILAIHQNRTSLNQEGDYP